MKLRELINKLEELSQNGINDEYSVEVEDFNGILYGILNADIQGDIYEHNSYNYVRIEIE